MNECETEFLLHQSIEYGILFSLGITLLFLVGGLWNREFFLRSYPPDIKAKYGPMSPKSKRQLIWFAIPVYVAVLGGLVFATMELVATCGSFRLLAVFLNNWILLNTANLFDLLIVDWLVIVIIQPNFVILPGTKGMKGYTDFKFHFVGFLKGVIYCSIASLVVSGIAAVV